MSDIIDKCDEGLFGGHNRYSVMAIERIFGSILRNNCTIMKRKNRLNYHTVLNNKFTYHKSVSLFNSLPFPQA